MVPKELNEFVKQMVKSGKSAYEVAQSLKKAGWDESTISQAIENHPLPNTKPTTHPITFNLKPFFLVLVVTIFIAGILYFLINSGIASNLPTISVPTKLGPQIPKDYNSDYFCDTQSSVDCKVRGFDGNNIELYLTNLAIEKYTISELQIKSLGSGSQIQCTIDSTIILDAYDTTPIILKCNSNPKDYFRRNSAQISFNFITKNGLSAFTYGALAPIA